MTDTSGPRPTPLNILLVEDNPGDARYIKEMFSMSTELSERAAARAPDGSGGATRPDPTVIHETRLSDGLARLEDEDVDVVLLDLNLPDSDGLDTLDTFRRHTDSIPIVILTGLADQEIGMTALSRGAEEYLVKDEINPELLVRSTHHAIERKAHEQELERQRNRLATINALNELVLEVTHLVIDASSRSEVEQQVCEHLAASDLIVFAWIGEVDGDQTTITRRAAAGVDDYLDEVTIRIDESEEGQGPTGRAVRTGSVQVAQNVTENPDYAPWQEQAREHGFNSSAAIPIEYESILYGVLNVYSERPSAFDDEERTVIARLGQVIGHAINAIERKEALMSEEVTEIRFRVTSIFDVLDVPAPEAGRITFDRAIPVSDDVYLEYGTVTDAAVDTLHRLVEDIPHFESVQLFQEDPGPTRFELRLIEPPVVSTIASVGGYVESAVIEDGDFTMVVHVPPSVDGRRVVDSVRGAYPAAEVVAQRQTSRRDRTASQLASVFGTELTERQRAALEAAFFAGFFEWPREHSGEDIADSMGVSPSTFHQHVRLAQQKLLRALFDGGDSTA